MEKRRRGRPPKKRAAAEAKQPAWVFHRILAQGYPGIRLYESLRFPAEGDPRPRRRRWYDNQRTIELGFPSQHHYISAADCDRVRPLHGLLLDEVQFHRWRWRYLRWLVRCGLVAADEMVLKEVEERLPAAPLPIYLPALEQRMGYIADCEEVLDKQTGKRHPICAAVVRARIDLEPTERYAKIQKLVSALEVRVFEAFEPLCPYAQADRFDKGVLPMPPVVRYVWREDRDAGSDFFERYTFCPENEPKDLAGFDGGKRITAARAAVKRTVEKINRKAPIRWQLEDWQREDIARLLVARSAIFAWVQGAGKTLGALTYAAALEETRGPRPVLFVVPQDLVGQWIDEAWLKLGKRLVRIDKHSSVRGAFAALQEGLRHHAHGLPLTPQEAKAAVAAGSTDWYITHYEALSRAPSGEAVRASDGEAVAGYRALKTAFRNGLIVADEATKIKGGATAVGLAVRALQARWRVVLTGTPIRNRLEDIFWLAWWVAGAGSPKFPYGYADGRKAILRQFGVQEVVVLRGGKRKRRERPDASNLQQLQQLLAPLVIRRRSQDVLAKVGVRIVPAFVPFGRRQRYQYESWLSESKFRYYWQQRGKDTTDGMALAQLSHLEYASTCPEAEPVVGLFDPPKGKSNWTPKSLRVLEVIAEKVREGKRVLFGSDLLAMTVWVAARLREAGVAVMCLTETTDGGEFKSVSPKQRGRLVQQFAAGEGQVLVGGVSGLSLGHNLATVQVAVIAGLPWDLATYEQFLGRVRRFSSIGDVEMHIVMTEGSLDARKWELLDQKRSSASRVLDSVDLIDDDEPLRWEDILRDLQARGLAADDKDVVDEEACYREWLSVVGNGPIAAAAATRREEVSASGRFRAVFDVAAAVSSGYVVVAFSGDSVAHEGYPFVHRVRGEAGPRAIGAAYDAAVSFVDSVTASSGLGGVQRALRLARMRPEDRDQQLYWWRHGPHLFSATNPEWWRRLVYRFQMPRDRGSVPLLSS